MKNLNKTVNFGDVVVWHDPCATEEDLTNEEFNSHYYGLGVVMWQHDNEFVAKKYKDRGYVIVVDWRSGGRYHRPEIKYLFDDEFEIIGTIL